MKNAFDFLNAPLTYSGMKQIRIIARGWIEHTLPSLLPDFLIIILRTVVVYKHTYLRSTKRIRDFYTQRSDIQIPFYNRRPQFLPRMFHS